MKLKETEKQVCDLKNENKNFTKGNNMLPKSLMKLILSVFFLDEILSSSLHRPFLIIIIVCIFPCMELGAYPCTGPTLSRKQLYLFKGSYSFLGEHTDLRPRVDTLDKISMSMYYFFHVIAP